MLKSFFRRHFNKTFFKRTFVPTTFSQLISVGEQTGQLDEMFGSVAMYYEEEFDGAVDNMSSLIAYYDRFYGDNDWWINDCDVFSNI